VLELQPLGLVDRHHPHRVDEATGARLFGLRLLGDFAAKAPEQRGRITEGFEFSDQIAKETIQVGDPVRTEVTRRFGRLEQR